MPSSTIIYLYSQGDFLVSVTKASAFFHHPVALRRLWISQIKTMSKTMYLMSYSCFKAGFAGPGPTPPALGRFLLTHSFGAVGRPRGECRKRELIQHIWPSIWSCLSHGGGHLTPRHHEETQADICILRKGGSQAIPTKNVLSGRSGLQERQ